MVARRVSRTRTPVRQRRKLVWASHVFNLAAAAGVSINTDLLADFKAGGASILGCTVMRIHALFFVKYANLADFTQMGICVGRQGDITTGTSPNPATNPEIDWMLNRYLLATASGAAVDAQRVIEIDLRSKRKIEELNQALVLIFTNGNAAGNTYFGFSRTLLALP